MNEDKEKLNNKKRKNNNDDKGKIVKKKKYLQVRKFIDDDVYKNNKNKNDNKCMELKCPNKIFVKKEYLCEYHYRKQNENLINRKMKCIYSPICQNKIKRKLLCYKHYKLFLSNDEYTKRIIQESNKIFFTQLY